MAAPSTAVEALERDGGPPFERAAMITPPAATTFLPAGLVAGVGRNVEMSMSEESVELEPKAILDMPDLAGFEPVRTGIAAPFEPGGLFFDLGSGGAAGQPRQADTGEADKPEMAAGGRSRKS
jgi:hypothetical protein